MLQISSPDGMVVINLDNIGGSLNYSMIWNGQQIIAGSGRSIFPKKQVEVIESSVIAVDTKWNPVWGEFS